MIVTRLLKKKKFILAETTNHVFFRILKKKSIPNTPVRYLNFKYGERKTGNQKPIKSLF